MHILITGGTSTLCHTTQRMQIQSFNSAFERALIKAGHTWEAREVISGEDLTKYDRVVVGIAPLGSMGARFVLGALYAMGQAHKVPVGILLNDWDIASAFNESRLAVNLHDPLEDEKGRKSILKPGITRYHREEAEVHFDDLWNGIARMHFGPWSGVIAPTFEGWGLPFNKALELVECRINNLVVVDPTPLVEVPIFFSENREKRWVSASLHPSNEWMWALKLGWPIEQIGVRSLSQPRLTEEDVIQLYSESWGVLSHPYYHAGSGWWRNRFNYSMANGCIMLASPMEVGVEKLGEHILSPNPYAIEFMGEDELFDFQLKQRKWFEDHAWEETRLVSAIDEWVRSLDRV